MTTTTRPVRAVLLDLYDTLVWTEWPALRRSIERRTGLSTERLLDAFDRTRVARSLGSYGSMEADLGEVLSAAGLPHDEGFVGELAMVVTRFLERGVHLWDDSIAVLRDLRARGQRTAIVSNCDHGTRPVVERLGLERETDAVVLSFEVGAAKPDAEIYLRALDAIGAEPAEAVFVDDQVTYCDGAAAVGIRAVLVARDGEATSADETAGGHEVIRDLRSLLELV